MIGAFFNAKKEGIIIAEFYVFETKYTLKAMLPSGQVVELTNLVTALEWAYKSALEKEICITAYNQIIKSTKSKDNNYYTAGKSTQDIVTELCGKWGIALKYNYGNHTHPKLVLNNQAVSAPDVPQIRKGDKIKVAAGNLSGFFYVKGVSHSATERTMEMELKR